MVHRSGLLILSVILLILPVYAQWSQNPLQNLAVADTSGEQVVPKISVTADGGCYISWFDNRNGNYSLYLQRLNSRGEPQFTPNGLLLSDHPQQSWITDYDLGVDGNDNAIIVFNDVRNGASSDWDIFAYKIGPDGSFLWGNDGIGLSDTTVSDFEVAPRVTVTSQNNAVIAWFKSDTLDQIGLQKISSDGQKMWGENGISLTPAASARLSGPGLVPAADDSVIMVWKSSTGMPWAPVTHLYCQKFGPDGQGAWGPAGVLIYDQGAITAWTDPQIYPDGNGGAFLTWYDAPSLSEFNVWVQHVAGNGQLVFPLNGVQASTSRLRLHMYPTLSYLPPTDELFVFWIEENFNQDQYGIYGQKISPSGIRLWTDDGRLYLPLGGNTISFLNSAPTDSGLYLSYFESSSPAAFDAAVKAFMINREGDLLWSNILVSSASLGNKDDLLMTVNREKSAFMVWDDKRNDNGSIYAQNIHPDGSLGNLTVAVGSASHNSPQGFELYQNYPNPFNASTRIEIRNHKNVFVTLKIFNILGEEVATLLSASLPSGFFQVEWDASGLASGEYFYRLEAGNNVQVRKMILMK